MTHKQIVTNLISLNCDQTHKLKLREKTQNSSRSKLKKLNDYKTQKLELYQDSKTLIGA